MPIPNPVTTDPLLTGTTTRLYVQTVAAGAVTWTEAMRVPINSELAFTPTGNVQSVPVFGEEFDRAVKTGRGGTLTFTTLAPADNAVVEDILTAADAVGPGARLRVLVVNPDLRAYVGVAVFEAAVPRYDARNVFGYGLTATMDGTYTPFTLAPGDIGAGV